MPTTPRAVKLTNGRTSAVWVSQPALLWTETTVPTGTPGTSGWSSTEAYVTTSCPGCSTVFASNKVSRSRPDPDMDLPVPVTDADLSAALQLHAEQRRRVVGQQDRRGVLAHLGDGADEPGAVEHGLVGLIPSLRPTSSVTVSE